MAKCIKGLGNILINYYMLEEVKIAKSMGELLIVPGVTNIDYKALQHIVGHRKVVYLRCTSPLYR